MCMRWVITKASEEPQHLTAVALHLMQIPNTVSQPTLSWEVSGLEATPAQNIGKQTSASTVLAYQCFSGGSDKAGRVQCTA